MKTWKKVLALVLALAMVIPGVYLGGSGSKEVQAETGEEVSTVTAKDHVEGWPKADAAKFIGTKTAPVVREKEDKANWLFAGWFSTDKCTLDGGITKLDDIEDGSTVYAKFVPVGILDVKAQSTPNGSGDIMRFVSSVDTLNYSKVGFEVTYKVDGKNVTRTNRSNEVYKKIESKNENINYEFDPKVVDIESDYFITGTMDITLDLFKNDGVTANTPFTVKAFWETFDGVRVRGEGRWMSIADTRATNTINLSFELKDGVSIGDDATLLANGEKVVGHTVDGTTVYVKVAIDKTTLKSATYFKFSVQGKGDVGSTVYRYLYTKYDGTENTIDTSWYTAYVDSENGAGETDKKEFTIATNAELYGLSALAKSGQEEYKFAGKTIYLVSDIALDGETYKNDWVPIGTQNGTLKSLFSGTFDGQGHTVSELYIDTTARYAGLFGATAGSSIVKNLKLKNSYIRSEAGDVGSIAGKAEGSFDTIYSDAIIECHNARSGGLVGMAAGNEMSMTNCWFAGKITHSTTTANKGTGGLVGIVFTGADLTMTSCYNSGIVDASGYTGHKLPFAGGLIGQVGEVNKGADVKVADSLNVGTVIDWEQATGGYGATIGYISSQSSVKLLNESVYYTNGSSDRAISNDGNLNNTLPMIVRGSIAGDNAQNNMPNLGWGKAWTSFTYGIPVLSAFEEEVLDTSWYNEDKAVYVLKDKGDLYGFAELSKDNDFAGKTVKLGEDIVINTGDAEKWAEGTVPYYEWTPIGNTACPFAGTFDGGMHTISGIYCNTTTENTGLFGCLKNKEEACPTIQNLKLVNSYIKSSRRKAGSIAGDVQGKANIGSVYSEAIVESSGWWLGGFVGLVFNAEVEMNNCQFAGKVISTETATTTGCVGGFVGNAHSQSTLTMTNCLNTGTVDVSSFTGGNPYAGGFIGHMEGSGTSYATVVIRNSINEKVVSIDSKVTTTYGPFVGYRTAGSLSIYDSICVVAEGYNALESSRITKDVSYLGKTEELTDETDLIGKNVVEELGFEAAYWETKPGKTPSLKAFTK